VTVPAATPQPPPHYSALRRLLACHPVASFLVMVYAVNVALVPVLIVTLPFALFHLPSWMVEFDLGLAQFHIALALTGVLGISQLFGRAIIMWLYNNTNYSVLLVGLFHSSFNVTTSALGPFIPVPAGSTFLIAAPVVAVAAVLLIVFTRGNLSYEPDRTPQPATP
jgi:hypothetical protein